jgi:hypothetical protein
MPSTLKGWLWLTALLACLLFPYLAKADDIMECIDRGRLAAGMVYAVSEGYDLDKVNVTFRIAPRNASEKADMDRYVEEVRTEVRDLIADQAVPANDKDFANRLGIKVSEACAFRYGKARGFMRDTASSTSIEGPPIGMEQYCKDLYYDLNIIGHAISDGIPAGQLRALANKSISYLAEERLARILRQISEAYAWDKPYIEYMDKEYAECAGK